MGSDHHSRDLNRRRKNAGTILELCNMGKWRGNFNRRPKPFKSAARGIWKRYSGLAFRPRREGMVALSVVDQESVPRKFMPLESMAVVKVKLGSLRRSVGYSLEKRGNYYGAGMTPAKNCCSDEAGGATTFFSRSQSEAWNMGMSGLRALGIRIFK
jgi:hypothetical protein